MTQIGALVFTVRLDDKGQALADLVQGIRELLELVPEWRMTECEEIVRAMEPQLETLIAGVKPKT